MKALVRNPGETVTENDGLTFIDWTNGAPLTNAGWFGGPYVLVNDYVPSEGEEDPEFTAPAPAIDPEVPLDEPESETVTIDGKEYTRAELLALLNQTN